MTVPCALLGAAATAALSAAALTGCGSGSTADAHGPTRTVTVKTFDFQPDPLRVKAGTTVVWRNEDQIDHTVTSGTRRHPDGRFDGRLPHAGSTFRRTFARRGLYRYFCRIHPGPGMTATVVVSR